MSAEVELVAKVQKLMSERFGGSDATARKKLFDAYDADADGQIDRDELGQLLADAGVGNGFTRGVWVRGVVAKLDADESKTISYAEFEGILG